MAQRWMRCGSIKATAPSVLNRTPWPACRQLDLAAAGTLISARPAARFIPLIPNRSFAYAKPKGQVKFRLEATAAPSTTPQPPLPSPPPSPPPPSPTLAWLTKVEGKLERGGQKVIEGARQRTQRALRGELADAVRSGDLNEAENTWTELRARTGSRLDEASCHTLMNAYAQRGHLRRALSLYARMKEWRVRPSAHTFSILFNAYANLAQPSPSYLPKLKQLKDQEMPKYGVVPSVEIYNVLLKAYLALDPEKSHQELKSVIAEMQEHRLKPDAITYTLWMATAARGIANNPKATVDVAAAFEVWDEMKKNRVHPNLRGYNELLKICNDGSPEDRDIAFELYKEMLVEGVTPDHHTFDILLMTCWKQRKFELANEIFDKAVQLNADNKGKQQVELDTHLCNSALRVCTRIEGKRGPGRKGGSAEADQYLLDIISKALFLPCFFSPLQLRITKVMFRKHLPYDEETYALLISAYTRAGAKEKAMSTFPDMQSKGQVRISKKTIGALLVTCRESNDVEEVKKVLDLAKDRRVRLTDSMVEEAKAIFIKNKRYQEWTRVERDLAEWLPTATADYATKGKRRASAVDGGDEDGDDEDDINNDIEAASVRKHPKATARKSSSAFNKPGRGGQRDPYAEEGRGGRERATRGGDEGPRRPEEGEVSARQERRRRWKEERSGGAGSEQAQRQSRPGREPKDRVFYKGRSREKSASATGGRKSFGGAPKPHAGRRKSPPSSLARNED